MESKFSGPSRVFQIDERLTMTQIDTEIYEGAKSSLTRVQNFDADSLPRSEKLGEAFSFSGAVRPAQELIDLYKRLSVSALTDFPETVLKKIKSRADSTYNLFEQILDFDAEQQDPSSVRNKLISDVEKAYATIFNDLHPYISYSLHKAADFQRLDEEARATFQSIKDEAEIIHRSLSELESEAQLVLEEIRKVAAEEGVTQQAVHFNSAHRHHTERASDWRKFVNYFAIALGVFAFLSLFIHRIPFLRPETPYDAFQLSVSKVLVFSVIAYMLFLSAKNFLNHKHNAIVNKHRQDALMTYTALVEASGDEGVKDAVLLQAANCIFSPQSTGYTANQNNDAINQKSMVEILSKPFSRTVENE